MSIPYSVSDLERVSGPLISLRDLAPQVEKFVETRLWGWIAWVALQDTRRKNLGGEPLQRLLLEWAMRPIWVTRTGMVEVDYAPIPEELRHNMLEHQPM